MQASPIGKRPSLDSFDCAMPLPGFTDLTCFSLERFATHYPQVRQWPVLKRILLENLLRNEDGVLIDRALITRFVAPDGVPTEIPFFPARVLMQDYAGISALVDFAGLRDHLADAGIAPETLSPAVPIDLVVDHSLQVDAYGSSSAMADNLRAEYRLNKSRYEFLHWAEQSISDLHIVPPGRGIVHQVNLEVLTTGVRVKEGKVFFDTLVGTDSHTPMANGLGVLGWGVGGIEALAVMLGQPVWLAAPRVLGIRLEGNLRPGVYAADIALTLTAWLRKIGVVGSFLEFFGPGTLQLSVFDKATIANMTPEYGATCSMFPMNAATLEYFESGVRSDVPGESAAALRAYLGVQGLLSEGDGSEIRYDAVHVFDLGQVQPSFAGPSRPDQLHGLAALGSVLLHAFPQTADVADPGAGSARALTDGAIAIAAITSCTNTSNPKSMIAAGLVARKAVALGLRVPPHVKCTLTPGSVAVDQYLIALDLLAPLETLGFSVAGHGCATCVGNSGELTQTVREAIALRPLVLTSVLSGNRNFESRIHPDVAANFLMAPPLVVALALAGTANIDPQNDPLAFTPQGDAVFLHDLMPDALEIDLMLASLSASGAEVASRAALFAPSDAWNSLQATARPTFPWRSDDSYFKRPDMLAGLLAFRSATPVFSALKPLLVLGDDVTTDHISPVGRIALHSDAGRLLAADGEAASALNSYGARRGNAGVMIRGTFDNPRLRNTLVDVPGPYTRLKSGGEPSTIFDASGQIAGAGYGAAVIAGKNYGTGSARDWAAKGQRLLGVAAVIAESFERIHRSNLVMFGVAPLVLDAAAMTGLKAIVSCESVLVIEVAADDGPVRPRARIKVSNGADEAVFDAVLRTDTAYEYGLLSAGGLLASLQLV